MADIIKLLPDSVANQIAAGEVIQRPSSAVKELMENSVDAGSTKIMVLVRDAGKSLVQVTDNGTGMSETDARLSFERHATSKISSADDLFAIRTMGFRGEALASVAAIAEVELLTRRHEDEIGTLVEIMGAKFVRQEPVACSAGCNIIIRNLFFNVPARRKFLKTNSTELRHIITEFQRIALAHPAIAFSLQSDNTEILQLPPAGIRQRLMHVFGRNINQQLVEINTSTSLVNIKGFIAKPEYARKSPGEQFFFINNRFMRHPYFHKAVIQAFEKLIPADSLPAYFICFEADPGSVDVNIHPTKTEIKFEDERAIWQILMASVREALGKFNLVPSIDFDTDGKIDIPVRRQDSDPVSPGISVNPDYNPFEQESGRSSPGPVRDIKKSRFGNWEELYRNFESETGTLRGEAGESIFPRESVTTGDDMQHGTPALMQLKNKYILTPVKSGLMIIDQKRAHERILYEKFMRTVSSGTATAQQQLYPVSIELSPADYQIIRELTPEMAGFGFEIRDFGRNSIIISGCPADTSHISPESMIENLIAEYKADGRVFRESIRESMARNLAASSAVHYGKPLNKEEMQDIIDRLFACEMPNYSPGGKTVITILGTDEIDKKLKQV